LDTADFEYSLPPELVATAPAERREDARLLVMDRTDGSRKHAHFRDLLAYLPPRSLLVLNDTRVFPARLRGRKPTGGAVEFLLTRRMSEVGHSAMNGAADAPDTFVEEWSALARGLGGGIPAAIEVGGGVSVIVRERREGGSVVVRITGPGPALLSALESIGEVPLPPYIEAARRRTPVAPAIDDRGRYQTVYASAPGAVAAPTAGLHFTPALLAAAREAGHELAFVTLHVGPGTFRPVEVADPRAHRLEVEHYAISADTAAAVARARATGRPIVAVGTTVVRTLEASARATGEVTAGEGATDLYILPGDTFQVVTDLVTNFHLPRSTLLMLVAAFAGRERVLAAYDEAVAQRYRFYSYGDAMLITGGGA
jgi:S-adenosylmethionine:tRNA ribosyltransferase-isomerase